MCWFQGCERNTCRNSQMCWCAHRTNISMVKGINLWTCCVVHDSTQSILPEAFMINFHPTMQHGAKGHLISTMLGLAHQCQVIESLAYHQFRTLVPHHHHDLYCSWYVAKKTEKKGIMYLNCTKNRVLILRKLHKLWYAWSAINLIP
jgi:hypothetical protein